MSKDYNKEIHNIEDSMINGAGCFEVYLQNKVGRLLNATDAGIENSYIFKEFIAKAQFLQHNMGLGESEKGFQTALFFAADASALNFSKETSKEMFNGFLHFVIANDYDFEFVGNLIEEWLGDGRELDEIDDNQLTPLDVAMSYNNIEAFKLLLQNGVDVTKLDNDGFAPIHRIISKIDDKTIDISVLELWIKNKLPIDTKDKYGNEALVYAKKWNSNSIIKLLEHYNLVEETNLSLLYLRDNESEKTYKHFKISNIQIKDSDLARAYVNKDLKSIKYLLNNDNLLLDVKIIDNKTMIPSDSKKIHIIELIRFVAYANQNYLTKDEKIVKLILEKSTNYEEVVQSLLYGLINKQEKFIEILIKNNVDINHNNSEILQILVGAGINYASAIDLAIKYGACVTDKILQMAKTNGTFKIIKDSSKLNKEIEKKLIKSKEIEQKLTPSEKIKLLLELINKKTSLDDIKLKFGMEGNHFSNLAQTIENNPKVLESLLIRHKITDFSNENTEVNTDTSLSGANIEEIHE